MRIVVTGATGNVGTALLRALERDPDVTEVVGIARRVPTATPSGKGLTWVEGDVTQTTLEPHFTGADAVVHLAWLIQPSRNRANLRKVNVEGSARVFAAAGRAGVPKLVHASSIGAYSPGPKDRPVDESWPTEGIPSSFYSVDKAAAERALERAEAEFPDTTYVRVRPGIISQRAAAEEQRRYFAGPFFPGFLADPRLIPLLPLPGGLVIQMLHAEDVAAAYHAVIKSSDASGAYNVAAEPALTPQVLAQALGARHVPVPALALRLLVDASWKLRLQPTPPGWLDMGMQVPVMDTSRIRAELGWSERHSATDVLLEALKGLREGADAPTPVLSGDAGGPGRAHEVTTGVGARNP